MKTATHTITAVTVLLTASWAHAVNYETVEAKSLEALQLSGSTFELVQQIPNNYGQQKGAISGTLPTQVAFELWDIARGNNPANNRQTMLNKANQAKNMAGQVEDLARSLKKLADDDDNRAVENLARSIKRNGDRMESLFRRIRRELD